MNVVVKRNVRGKWTYGREGSISVNAAEFTTKKKAVKAAKTEFPDAEIFVDFRRRKFIGRSKMIMIVGTEEPRKVA